MKIVHKEASPELVAELERQRVEQEREWRGLYQHFPAVESARQRELRQKYERRTLTMAEFKEYFGL